MAAMATAADDRGLSRLVAALEARREQLVDLGVELTRARVPSYSAIDDLGFWADLRQTHWKFQTAFCDLLLSGRAPTLEDAAFMREAAIRRVAHGIPLGDFMHAIRIGQLVTFDALTDLEDTGTITSQGALAVARKLVEINDFGATVAGEAYLEAQQTRIAEQDRVRRDVLEDLLAGREPSSGSGLAVLAAAGLQSQVTCVVVVATLASSSEDEADLRFAASTLTRGVGGAVQPLGVVRQEEIVIVRPTRRGKARTLTARLSTAQETLKNQGVTLAIGMSTPQPRGALPDAYREARMAIMGARGPGGGVVSLCDLSAFEFLTLGGNATAWRLFSDDVRQFVVEDLRNRGMLIDTLQEYAAANLNAVAAAQRLFLHVNTVYYRLGRIAEKTRLDMHRFHDVQELLIAVRLAQQSAASSGDSSAGPRIPLVPGGARRRPSLSPRPDVGALIVCGDGGQGDAVARARHLLEFEYVSVGVAPIGRPDSGADVLRGAVKCHTCGS